ncbi:MAG: chorismate mutase [Oscillospiraceae bacterium]|nr:chorismate mutase [Oscillospiraceae bacterium]
MNIDSLRKQIDAIDNEILRLFLERMNISKEIGAYKKVNALPIRDKSRENAVIQRLCENISPESREYVTALYTFIFDASSEHQEIFSKNP